jgi:hypothetical protein
MKYLGLLFFLAPISAKAQTDIFNISLYDSTKPVLYSPVENRLRIKGVNTDESTTSITNGLLTRINRNYFLASVKVPGETTTIKIERKGRIILIKEFKTDTLPGIRAAVGYIYDSTATVNKILSNPFLTAGCHCDYNMNISIFSFSMAIKQPGIVEESFEINADNKLTKQQIEEIKKCNPGDKLMFSGIRAGEADGRTRKLEPFTITIK